MNEDRPKDRVIALPYAAILKEEKKEDQKSPPYELHKYLDSYPHGNSLKDKYHRSPTEQHTARDSKVLNNIIGAYLAPFVDKIVHDVSSR